MTSGGADSVPVLYYVAKIVRPKHVLAIHADYGQRMMEMERLGVTRNVENLKRPGVQRRFQGGRYYLAGAALYLQACAI